MATGVQQVTTPQVTPQIPTSAPIEREFTVKSRSQTQQALRRFMHNKLAMAALFVYVVLLLVSFIYPHFYRWTFDGQDASSLSVGPGTNGHPFGTDEIGRDLLARMMMGIQRSTYISVIFVLVAGTIGVLIGAISGYFGKWVDNVLMRFVDIILTVPILVAIIVVAANFPGARSPIGIALFIAILGWMDLARIVRSSFLSLREREYVEAAHALGASDKRIILKHLIPNSLGQNIPNPFNPSTTIRYSVSSAGPVSIRVYNAGGALVRTLVSTAHAPGAYSVRWDGTDDRGRHLGSGVYFYRIESAGGFRDSKKLILLK